MYRLSGFFCVFLQGMRKFLVITLMFLAGALNSTARDWYAEAEELYYANRYPEAIRVAQEGASQSGITEEQAVEFWSILGSCYARLGAFDKAAEYMIRCYRYDKAQGEQKGLTSSLINLASMYVYAGEPELALDYALEAIANEQLLDRPDKLAMAYGKACDVYHALGADSTALHFADRAVAIAQQQNNRLGQAIRRSQRAYPLSALGRHEAALADLRFSEDVFRDNDARQSLAIVCFQLAQEYGRKGGSKTLEQKYLQEAASIARALNDQPLLQKICSRLAASLRESHPAEAYGYLEEAARLQEEIADSKRNNALELFNVEYETARREATIAAQQEDIAQKRLQRDILLILLLLLIAAACVTVIFAVRQHRSERRLRQSNAQKDFLLKVISHDIHSPAVAQLRGIQMIRESVASLSPEQMNEVFLQLERQAESEVELIENVLRWAKRKVGNGATESVRFSLPELVRETLTQYAGAAELKEIHLSLESPKEVSVCTNRNNLALVLRNLLSNAVKFSYRGGDVLVRIEPNAEGAAVSVVDHGVGIPQDKLPQIFSSDSPWRRAGTDGEPSNGLGLAVSRDLIEESGGKLLVESGEGSGSVFTILIVNTPENG